MNIVQFPWKTVNKYGVDVMNGVCQACGQEFSVTPYPKNIPDWLVCMTFRDIRAIPFRYPNRAIGIPGGSANGPK